VTKDAEKVAVPEFTRIEVIRAFRLCSFRCLRVILMVRDPGGFQKEALMGCRHGGPF